jgi:16S rRNA (guanine1207-N2)-methyltransferase
MSEHYYTQTPTSRHDVKRLTIALDGRELAFDTDAGVFSRGELDAGTELMIRALPPLSGRVLDLGCGWGPLGLFVKARNPEIELTSVDINERAVELTAANARLNGLACTAFQSDGFAAIDGQFETVLTNPPIRAGKKVIYSLFAQAKEHLSASGALYIVIQTKQGADSALRYLNETYAGARVISRGGGFKVIEARM